VGLNVTYVEFWYVYCSLPSVCTTFGGVLFNGVIKLNHSIHVEVLGANSWCLTEYCRLKLANSERSSYYSKYLSQTGCMNFGILYCYESCTIWKAQGPRQFTHTASILKMQSGQFSLRSQMNNGNSIYNYSYLLQFIVCFLSVDFLFGSTAQNETKFSQISTSRRSFFRRPIHRLGKCLPTRSRTRSTKYIVPYVGHYV